MPNIGFWATAGAGGGGGTPVYELIQTATPSGQASFTFSSIPNTYKHLEIRASFRSTRASTDDPLNIAINFDTANGNYTWHLMGANISGTTVSSSGYATGVGASRYVTSMTSNDVTASVFTHGIFSILDYTNTAKYKTMRGISGFAISPWFMCETSKLWLNTNAITDLTFGSATGNTFVAGTRFSLYGIKG